MKNTALLFLLIGMLACGCRSVTNPIFHNKTPLEKYTDRLEESGLQNTPEGKQWLAASENALRKPVSIEAPFRLAGRFSAKRPQALGLRFSVRQGERLHISISKKDSAAFVLYAELYRQSPDGNTALLQAVDTNVAGFMFDVPEAGAYVLKLQPQLFRVGEYSLAVSTGPSLFFPVADRKASIGSVWGDARDGGKRSHEGVDIFAPKGTPAVAAADGLVVGVRESGLGGKTVWLRPEGKAVTLYYAHLDAQLVQERQRVRQGDTVGLVGNTGNARTTPAHLHFGVYGLAGAVNPFPFVNRAEKEAPSLPSKKLAGLLRLQKAIILPADTLPKNTLLFPLALTAQGVLAEEAGGQVVLIPFAAVQEADKPIRKAAMIQSASLLPMPAESAVQANPLLAGTSVSVLGYAGRFVFVRAGASEGWLPEHVLEG